MESPHIQERVFTKPDKFALAVTNDETLVLSLVTDVSQKVSQLTTYERGNRLQTNYKSVQSFSLCNARPRELDNYIYCLPLSVYSPFSTFKLTKIIHQTLLELNSLPDF